MFREYPDVMTPAEAARALGIGKASVYRLIREKRLGCKRIGRYTVTNP